MAVAGRWQQHAKGKAYIAGNTPHSYMCKYRIQRKEIYMRVIALFIIL